MSAQAFALNSLEHIGRIGGSDELGKAEDNSDDIFHQDSDRWEINPPGFLTCKPDLCPSMKVLDTLSEAHFFFFWIFYRDQHPMLKGKGVKNKPYPYLS